MRYEEYAKKIAKKKKTWKFFYRFRVPLILFVSLVFATTGSLVGGKGVTFDQKVVEQSYTYGQPYEYSAYSFLSTASYEFASIDSDEWSEVSPTWVGQYKMRSKGQNSFNTYYYGKEHTFEIVPKVVNVVINEDQITYGETPTISLDLVSGDRLESGYDFTINSDLTLDKWNYVPNESSIKILNAAGENVTECYSFNIVNKEVNILKRGITITSDSGGKIYDGEELKVDSCRLTSGSLGFNDHIEATALTSIVDASTAENEQSYKIINKDGLDMTSHYSIESLKSTLTIKKRQVTFSIGNFEHVYDGEKHLFSLDDITYSSEDIVSNQTPVFSYSYEEGFLKVGEYTNAFSVKIVDGNTDVSNNYNIKFDYGKTVITKRPLSVVSASDNATYDGSEHEAKDYSILDGSLASKDTVDITVNKFVDAGEYTNEATVKIVDKLTNEDFTSCYDLGVTYGTYTIEKAKITVEVDTLSVTYDGLPHKNTCHISSGSLIGEDKLEIVNNEEKIDVGTYDKDEFEVKVKTKDNVDNTANYEIEYTNTKDALTIKKRPITINTNSKEKKYDAKSIVTTLPEDSVPYVISSGSLANNEAIEFKYLNDLTNAGEVAISSEVKIFHEEGTEKNNVTSNYDVTVNNGNFTINQRNITIKTLDFTHVYDRVTTIPGDKQTFEVTDGGDGLIAGHQVTKLSVNCDEVDVGSYSYDIDYSSLKIEDANKNDVTSNYNVTYLNEGKVIITKRPATLTMGGNHKVYDGQPLTCENYTSTNLLAGDFFTFNDLPSVIHVMEGKVTNTPGSWQVFMSDGEEVTSNYEVTLTNPGKIYVEPRPITVTSPTLEKIYDGKEFNKDNDISVTFGSLASGDTIVTDSLLSRDNSYKHVIDIDNSFTMHIINPSGMDVTLDYKITTVTGKIRITPRPLVLESADLSKVFDGQLLEKDNDIDIVDGTSLAEGDVMTINSLNSRDFDYVHVTDEENSYSISINNGDYEDVYNDYEIEYRFGQITIDPCQISLTVFETYIPYDGLDHAFTYSESNVGESSTMIYLSNGALPDGFTLDVTISIEGGEMINVGSYSYAWNYTFNTSSPYGVEEGDFDVTLVGVQEISPRIIVIQTLSGIKIYDGLPFGSDMDPNDLAWISSGSLADGEEITIVLVPVIEVGSYSNEVASVTITGANGETTDNYLIYFIYGGIFIDEN